MTTSLDSHGWVEPPREPAPPVSPDLAQRIAAATDRVQACQIAADEALQGLVRALQRQRTARPNTTQAERAAAEVTAARHNREAAMAALESAIPALVEALGARDAEHRAILLARSTR